MAVTRKRKAQVEKYWKLLYVASRFLGKIRRRIFCRMENFDYFPNEIIQMIVDRMTMKARCRFATSSRMCRSFVKSCQNHMYGISFDCRSRGRIEISVGHSYQQSSLNNFSVDYSITFFTQNQKKIMKGSRRTMQPEKILETDCEIVIDAIHLFEKIVNENRLSIRYLQVQGAYLINREFALGKLKKLEKIFMDTLNPNFVNALYYPLKEVQCYRYPISHATPCIENLSRVQNMLLAPLITFNYEELKLLSATEFEVSIGNMSAQDMFNFIKYQLENHDENIRSMTFINDENNKKQFNNDLLELLNVQVFTEMPRQVKVYKSNLKGKFARIGILPDSIYYSYPFDGNHVKYKLEEVGIGHVISII